MLGLNVIYMHLGGTHVTAAVHTLATEALVTVELGETWANFVSTCPVNALDEAVRCGGV